jgi:hypothetical protein
LSQKQSEATWKKVEKKTMKEMQKLEKMQGGRGESDNGPKRSGRLTNGWRNLTRKLLQ